LSEIFYGKERKNNMDGNNPREIQQNISKRPLNTGFDIVRVTIAEIASCLQRLGDQHEEVSPNQLDFQRQKLRKALDPNYSPKTARARAANEQIQADGAAITKLHNIDTEDLNQLKKLIDKAMDYNKSAHMYRDNRGQRTSFQIRLEAVKGLEITRDLFHIWKRHLVDNDIPSLKEIQDPAKIEENINKYFDIGERQHEHEVDGLKFIFPDIDWEEHEKLIDTCDNCYHGFMQINPQNREEHIIAFFHFYQSITEVEISQSNIERSIEGYEASAKEATKTLRECKDYNNLPEDVKNYIKISWKFQESTLKIELKRQKYIKLLGESKNETECKNLATEIKGHIRDFLENPGNQRRMHLLKETSNYITSYNSYASNDIIKSMASYEEILKEQCDGLQNYINNPKLARSLSQNATHLSLPTYLIHITHTLERILNLIP
jgi:hypothetical protein